MGLHKLVRFGVGASVVALCLARAGADGFRAWFEFSTYLGGTYTETVTAVALDPSGAVYVAGSTNSLDFPVRQTLFPPPTQFTPTTFPTQVGFLSKIGRDGSIVYSTFLALVPSALAVDLAGSAIVAENVPIGSRFSGPLGDVEILKIDSTGTRILYSIRLAGRNLEEATALAADAAGNVVVTGQTNSPDFPLVNAIQSSSAASDNNAFVTKLDPAGRILFSTLWGGSEDDRAAAVAVDKAGDIYVAGTTGSPDFATTPGAFQRRPRRTGCRRLELRCVDAFVTKFSGDGRSVFYSTLFGGTESETVRAVAVDTRGSAHIAGITESDDLPLRRPLQSTCDDVTRVLSVCSAFIAKLNPSGSDIEYATFFGSRAYYVGGLGQTVKAVSVDSEGRLVATGATEGNDLPLAREIRAVNAGGPLFKSTDGGVTWTSSSRGLTGTGIWGFQAAGRSPVRLFASTFNQVFRSSDGGMTWRGDRLGPWPAAVDPQTPSILYGVTRNGCFKSVDGGDTWTKLTVPDTIFYNVAIAPSAPWNVYVATPRGVFHSPDGGSTWSLSLDLSKTPSAGSAYVRPVAVDPRNADAVYAAVSDGKLLRKGRGEQWTSVARVDCPINRLLFPERSTSAMYAQACGRLWKSVDDARSWRAVDATPGVVGDVALDPAHPDTLYLATYLRGVQRSTDGGDTWQALGFADEDLRSILVDPSDSLTIYIGKAGATNAFVTRFDAEGAVNFSTYLGGMSSYGSAIAADGDGTIVVAGFGGRDFPLEHPIQSKFGGSWDAFIARISLEGKWRRPGPR